MKKITLIVALFLVSSPLAAQQPAQVSLEYYIDRVQQSDFMAAQLRHERDQLKQQVQTLTQQLADKTKEKKPEPPNK